MSRPGLVPFPIPDRQTLERGGWRDRVRLVVRHPQGGGETPRPDPAALEAARFRALAAHLDQVLWVSPSGFPCRSYVSPAFETLWGRPLASLEETRGNWAHTVHPEDRAAYDAVAANPRGGFSLDYRIVRPDGDVRWVRERAFPADPASPGDLVGCVQDVTREKSDAERGLRAERPETWDRLAGGVAHDLNNLITVIAGRADLLLRRVHGDVSRGDASVIRHASEQAAALTRFLGATSAHQMVSPRLLDVNAALQGHREAVREKLGGGISLHQTFESRLHRAKLDPRLLEEVLLALAGRAASVMPEGGKFLVETRNATLDAAYVAGRPMVRPGNYVLLALSDTGTPLSQEEANCGFKAGTLEAGHPDLLPMIYGMVKQCGGYIWAYAEPELGTTFKLYFPAAAEDVPGPPTAPRRLTGTETLLLVEDQEAVRTLAREILEDAGYSVLEAEDGNQALLLAEALGEPIDLLVTDAVLPGSPGKDVVERLRAAGWFRRALFMSGYTAGALTHHELLEERFPFLQKPFSPEGLLSMVRQALDEPERV